LPVRVVSKDERPLHVAHATISIHRTVEFRARE
jgi:hypothetical protein